jgi:hypothetical protein
MICQRVNYANLDTMVKTPIDLSITKEKKTRTILTSLLHGSAITCCNDLGKEDLVHLARPVL